MSSIKKMRQIGKGRNRKGLILAWLVRDLKTNEWRIDIKNGGEDISCPVDVNKIKSFINVEV